jgi:hypothetical protein
MRAPKNIDCLIWVDHFKAKTVNAYEMNGKKPCCQQAFVAVSQGQAEKKISLSPTSNALIILFGQPTTPLAMRLLEPIPKP